MKKVVRIFIKILYIPVALVLTALFWITSKNSYLEDFIEIWEETWGVR